jgi:hypothetical protein
MRAILRRRPPSATPQRARSRSGRATRGRSYYEDSPWFNPFVGGSHEFLRGSGARDLDARTMFHYGYTAVTPAMVVEIGSA